jgi:hypothetical protein
MDELEHARTIERIPPGGSGSSRPAVTHPLKETAMPDTDDQSPHLLVHADVWRRVHGLYDEVIRRAGDAGRVLVVARGPLE